MSTDNSNPIGPVSGAQSARNPFLSWEIMLLYCLICAAVAVMFETPSGSISGKIALEEQKFGLYSYNIRQNKVYAVATGPRDGITIARGVWVNNDGSFNINQLPVGEYELKVRAPGFQTEYVQSVFVTAGKNQAIPDAITLEVLQPSVSIASNVRVFTTKENPHFWINATGAVQAKVKLYKKPFFETIYSGAISSDVHTSTSDLSLYTSYNEKFDNPFPVDEKPFRELVRQLKPNYEDSARADFKLDNDLAPGDYFVVAECVDITAKKQTAAVWWFSVSDIGLITKHAPGGSLIRAIDLNTLKPASGVHVKLINKEDHTLASVGQGTTGSDGIAFIKVENNDNYECYVIGERNGHTAYGAGGYWYGGSDGRVDRTTYFYTDRPVYRLGQTVYFKGMARHLEKNGWVNDGAEQVTYYIEDPSNVQLASGTIQMSKFGTYNGEFSIPAEGKTGAYSLKLVYDDGGESYQYIEVDQYRKPEYKIDVKTQVPRVSAGSKVKATVSATYFFGGPVANARIKYSVYSSGDWNTRYNLQSRPGYYSFFDNWNSGDEESYDYGGTFVAEGFAQTDENGQAVVEFDTKKIEPDLSAPGYYNDYRDKNYKIEAEVTDISRLTAVGSGNISVTAGDFCLFVRPDSWVVQAGAGLGAEIQAIDYEGKPVANQAITVKISRWPINAVTHAYEGEKVLANLDLTTDREGKANLQTRIGEQWPTDTFYVTAVAKDKNGNTVVDSDSIWVASERYPYLLGSSEAEREPFKISLDKKVYKPGETAHVMLSGPFTGKEGYDALITIEGTGLYTHRVVPLTATANHIEIPIEKTYTPNVYIAVTMVAKKKQFYQGSEMIMVSPEDHFLKLAVATDKQKYKPGETAKYTIKASYENGKPAPNTELSLGVVDESIYSIRSETAGDIRKTFYSQRSNKVNTFCSFPETYSGGPDKTAQEPKLRKNFKDTAAWFPQLVTDKDGIARAQVTLPDNLTTWRATVRGITMGCDVGAVTQQCMVTQDIIARLALPRFFTEGDQGEIAAVVHNYSDQKQEIRLTLTVSDQFKTNAALAQNLSIDKDKAARFIWPVTIAKPGQGVIRLKAQGQTGGDFLERKLPVNNLGVPLFNADSGMLTDNNPVHNINFGDVGKIFSPELTVSLSGSTIGQVQGSYDSLIDYPYGCTEQTMSKFMPSIIAMQLNKNLKVPLKAESIKRFEYVYKLGMAKLSDHQHSDGGWGWWRDDASDPYMTSLVLEGLYLLKGAGYHVEDTMQTNGLNWLTTNSAALEKLLSDPKLVEDWNAETRRCDMARLAYAISLYKKKPSKEVVAYIKNKIPTFTPEPLAYTALALKNIGDEAGAQQAYQRLIALANKSETTVDWEHTDAMIKRLKLINVKDDWSYRYTGEETTALALRAVLAIEPDKTELIESIKTWLLYHREKGGWANTKTTSEVLHALLDDAILQSKTTGETINAKILMNEIVKYETSFTGGEIYSVEKQYKLPFTPETQRLRIEKSGQGRLYYHSLLTYTKALRPGEKVPLNSSPKGLSITRSFYRLESKPAGADGVLHVVSKPFNGGSIKEGETILMKVQVDSPMSLPYVMVECPLPSGAEVVQSAGAQAAASEGSEDNSISGDWGQYWWSHQDILDDKIVFFGTYIPSGKKEFYTLLRMELPGKVQLNPVTLEGMYTKLIRGYTQSDELTIAPMGK